jgi:hypothetical protein
MDHDRTARPNAIPWPPILYGGGALLAVLLHQAAPIPARWLGIPPLSHLGEAMILAGLALDLWAMATMWRARANILPHRIRVGGPDVVALLMAELAAGLTSRGPSLGKDAPEVFLIVQDLQRYAPGTPDYAKPTRWQELGFYTNVGIRGTF